ncbi:MAG: HD-GYP domain-containing protein [Halopseudomonas sp.]
MLKKIAVKQATPGMFVQQFCGTWVDHPFWSRQLLITDAAMLEKLRASAVRNIIIDLSRGVDVSPEPVGSAADPADADTRPVDKPAASRLQSPAFDSPPRQVSLHDEMQRARQLISRGKQDVIRMFADVRMGRVVESDSLQLLVSDMSDSLLRNAHALLSLVRIKRRDEYTYLHSVAVAALMMSLARSQGCDEANTKMAGMGGLLHDLGKVAMPDHILNKPGKLSAAEFEVMKGHPVEGAALLQALANMPAEAIDACLHHHEKYDGSGYPGQLAGENISVMARMAAICDVYDAITSNRPYHAGDDPALSLSRMASWEGHFDPHLFQQFVCMLGIYPVGSLVRLRSDRLAVVIEQNPDSLLKPRLVAFYSVARAQRIPPAILDLASRSCDDAITGRENPESWHFTDLDQLWMSAG